MIRKSGNRFSEKDHALRMRSLGDQLNRRHHDLAAGDLAGLFGVVLEEVA
jgi:hypothetical protein